MAPNRLSLWHISVEFLLADWASIYLRISWKQVDGGESMLLVSSLNSKLVLGS